jgi:GxxExxY protein
MGNVFENTNWMEVRDPLIEYSPTGNTDPLTYSILGACYEVHNQLGRGFSEVVYKDALQYELSERGILFEREKKYHVHYKGQFLKHHYFADFVVDKKVILEIKAQSGAIENHYKQVLNYLAASGCQIGLIVNFCDSSVKYKRVILTK